MALIVVGGVTPASAAHDNSHGKTPEHAEANHAAAEQKSQEARDGSDNAGGDAARPEQKRPAAGREGGATRADNRARPQAGTTKRPDKTGVKSTPAAVEGKAKATRGKQAKNNDGKGREAKANQATGKHGEPNPPKHDPVTVCHLLGNGSYIELTFDDSALDAHLAHGDLYPAPTAGCPAAEGATASPDTAVPGISDGDTDRTDGFVNEVAGVSQEVTHQGVDRAGAVAGDMVLGVEQQTTANRAAATLAPSAGLLPQTGAGRVALLVVAGLGALAAGAALLSRRRLRTGR